MSTAPAASAFLADLNRQVGEGASEPPPQRRRADAAASAPGAAGSQESLLKDLLRFTLYRSQDVAQLMNSQALAFLLSSEESKRTIKENCDAYRNKLLHQHNGDIEGARQRAREAKEQLPAHPWGLKKTFHTVILLRCLKQSAQDWSDEQNSAYEYLHNLTAEQMEIDVSSCQSKFQQPMTGRVWKFSLILSSTCSPETRAAFSTLLKVPCNGVRFEQARELQSELEKKLWTRLVQQ